MPPADYPGVPPKSRAALAMFAWAAVFFACINLAVWWIYDVHSFAWVGARRLLMNPSENEIQSIVDDVRGDAGMRHVVVLGDSIAWGVGVDDPAQTFAGIAQRAFAHRDDVRVLNLATPGDTFFDIFAILRRLYRPEDVYVVVLDPLVFYKQKLDSWQSLSRFSRFDAETLAADRDAIERCCAVRVPAVSRIDRAVRAVAWRLLPLYRERDTINMSLFGLTASNAATALLDHTLFTGGGKRDVEVRPALESLHPVPFALPGHPLLEALPILSRVPRGPNILYVIADEATYLRDDRSQRNIDAIVQALGDATVLNLHATLGRDDITGDGIHLTPAGHAAVADRLLPLLSHALP